MNENDFQQLSLKILSGEASKEEQKDLQSLIESDSSKKELFHSMRQTFTLSQIGLPIVEASDAKNPDLPLYRMNELRDAVKKKVRQETRSSIWNFPILQKAVRRPGLVMAMAGLMACFGLTFLLQNQSPVIEVGMIKDEMKRGNTEQLQIPKFGDVKVLAFQKDSDFDTWKSKPMTSKQKAKIWIDEEEGVFRMEYRTPDEKLHVRIVPLEAQDMTIEKLIQLLP